VVPCDLPFSPPFRVALDCPFFFFFWLGVLGESRVPLRTGYCPRPFPLTSRPSFFCLNTLRFGSPLEPPPPVVIWRCWVTPRPPREVLGFNHLVRLFFSLWEEWYFQRDSGFLLPLLSTRASRDRHLSLFPTYSVFFFFFV